MKTDELYFENNFSFYSIFFSWLYINLVATSNWTCRCQWENETFLVRQRYCPSIGKSNKSYRELRNSSVNMCVRKWNEVELETTTKNRLRPIFMNSSLSLILAAQLSYISFYAFTLLLRHSIVIGERKEIKLQWMALIEERQFGSYKVNSNEFDRWKWNRRK